MKRQFDWNLTAGFVLTGIIFLMLLVNLVYTPYDPNTMNIAERFQAPGFHHLCGTDNFGRDIFSRIMDGTKTTFFIAVSTVLIGVLLGVSLGAIAGFKGGWLDEIIMRINDALTAFPGILLALVLVTVLGQSKYTIVLALGLIFIPSFARITRSGFLQLKEEEFVKSAQVFGASSLRIMFIHILPNVYPSLLAAITIGFSNAILAEAGMSFLGFGVQPPDPSWGRMLSEAQAYLFNAPWYAVAPGVVIMITVLGFNFIGEGLRKIYG
jgi:ABC-type dipeptide/oligopeptide/nickel transport systems, permease components